MHAKMRYLNDRKSERAKRRREEEAFTRDEEENTLCEIEDMLIENVQILWKETRKGPHDDCDCYWFHCHELRHAIKRLRAFRKGVYWG